MANFAGPWTIVLEEGFTHPLRVGSLFCVKCWRVFQDDGAAWRSHERWCWDKGAVRSGGPIRPA